MRDSYGRDMSYLRISLTDRCNFRCHYCMPAEGITITRHDDLLTFREIAEIVGIANDLGIRRFRLTGGEPLVRRGVVDLIRLLRETRDIEDLSMTTNAYLLPGHARELKEAGLDRINISIDSLDPGKFRWITRGGDLDTVLQGIDAALEAGLAPVKTNTVIMAGINDDEIPALIDYLTIDKPVTARFIEYMPISQTPNTELEYVNLTDKLQELRQRYNLQPTTTQGNGPARYWRAPGATGAIGFITPISNKYCAHCSRLRLDAHGTIRPCLAYDLGISLRDALRHQGPQRVRELIENIILRKPKEHHWEDGQLTPLSMSNLGG